MVQQIRSLIREPRENKVLDDEIRSWINSMSFEQTKLLNYPWKEMTLYGIEEQADYDLPSDFVKFHPLLDIYFDNKKLVKHDAKWLERQYPDFLTVAGQEQVRNYYIRYMDKISLYPPPKLQASGTDTTGSGTTTLNDSAANFTSDYVGYAIRNVTDGSYGLITAVNSTTQLVADLAEGTLNVWTLADEYKINKSGEVPYIYKEATVSADDAENEVMQQFPWLIIYSVMPLVEIKAFRTDPAAQFNARNQRYDTLYAQQFSAAKKIVNDLARGHRSRTIRERQSYYTSYTSYKNG